MPVNKSDRRRGSKPSPTSMSTCDAIHRDTQTGAPAWIIITAFIILVSLGVALVYQYLIRNIFQSSAPTSPMVSELFSSSTNGARLYYLFVDGCMWCDKFSPEWSMFVKKQGNALSASGVSFAKINGQDNDPRVEGLLVKGYPTIVLIPDGAAAVDAIVFNGARSADTLGLFVQTNVPGYSYKA